MNSRLKGIVFGIVAAVSYGTNPLWALFLYEKGVNVHSVLFYRFFLAALMLGGFLLAKRESFSATRRELGVFALLGVLFAVSSMSLFASFHHMDAGIASTLLFVYPVMVAVIMAVFFKEKITLSAVFSIILALTGIGLLYQGDSGTLSLFGVFLVMLSSLTYALYIVTVNRASLAVSSVKMTFYVLIFCGTSIFIHSFFSPDTHIRLLGSPSEWGYGILMALVPTVISLIMMTISVNLIGSTPAAILGALEPLTAVVIGVTVFGESFTLRLAAGILLILASVLVIIAGKSFSLARICGLISAGRR